MTRQYSSRRYSGRWNSGSCNSGWCDRRLYGRTERCWRAVAVGVLCLVGLAVAAGCSDRDRRLSEGEALGYKRDLLLENPGSISEDQADTFGHDRARTKAEIDQRFDELRRDYAQQQAEERARFEAERARASGSTGAGSGQE